MVAEAVDSRVSESSVCKEKTDVVNENTEEVYVINKNRGHHTLLVWDR